MRILNKINSLINFLKDKNLAWKIQDFEITFDLSLRI